MTRKVLIFELLMIAAAIGATLTVLSHMPERVATHWGMNGEPNGFSPRESLWAFGPGALTALLALTAVLPWLSPRRFEVDSFRSTYNFIMLAVFLMMAYVYGIILWAGSGIHVDVSRFAMGGVCLFIAVIGNVLSKVRPNFYIGVRTPWTLANEKVWYATHRFAAKSMVLGGVLGLAMAIAGVQFGPVAAIMAGALAPVVYSLVLYKQLEHRGEL